MSTTTDIWLPSGVEEGPAYGTPEWHQDRIGRVTASRFKDVMTEPRSKAAKEAGELSDTALAYLHEVIAQAITGKERVGGKSAAMDRGVDLEADALDYYADTRMVELRKGRLLKLVGANIGASPDGFIEDDPDGPGLVETKCPESKTHLATWFARQLPDEYYWQVHGQLWVSGRHWCDFVSYDDRFPLPMRMVVIRVHRNEEVIAELAGKVEAFASRALDRIRVCQQFLAEASPQEHEVVRAALETGQEDLPWPSQD